MATPIEIKSELIIEQIRLDARAKAELDRIKISAGIVPGSGTPEEKAMDAAAKRQGFERGEKAKPDLGQRIGSALADPMSLAINSLVKVLEIGLQNSKIANMLQKKVNEALGLLVDLILLPFLPILIWVLINLFRAVLWLGDMWKKFVAGAGLGKVGSAVQKATSGTTPEGKPKTALDYVVDWLIVLNSLSKAWFDIMGLILKTILYGAAQLIIAFLKFWWDVGWEIGKIIGIWIHDNLWHPIEKAFQDAAIILKPLNDIMLTLNETIMGFFTFAWVQEYLDLFKAKVGAMITEMGGFLTFLGELKTKFDEIINAIGGAIDKLYKKVVGDVTGAVSDPAGWIKGVMSGGWMTQAAEGGTVSKTGMAVIHSGETIIPAGKGGNVTFNFYGYQDDAFIRKVRDVMRGDATRYSQ